MEEISKLLILIRNRKLQAPLILLVLFLFSAFLAYPLLLGEIPMPSEFSSPLLPFLISSLSLLTGVNPELAGMAIVYSFYVLTPLSFFLFAKYLVKNIFLASVSAIFYNFPPPLAFILPSWRMAIVENGIMPLQAIALLVGEEVPHIVGLFFLPLAAIFFLKYIRHGIPKDLAVGAVLAALVALTSRAMLWAFFILCLALIISDGFLSRGKLKFKRAILFTICALGLSAFWYTPLFWGENLKLVYEMGILRGFGVLFPLSFVFLPILGIAAFLLCERRPKRHIPLTIFLLYLFFGGTVFAGEFFGLSFAPYPHRYLLELHLAASLLWGYIAIYGFNLLRRKAEKIERNHSRRARVLLVSASLGVLFFVGSLVFLMRRSLLHLGGPIYLGGPYAAFPSLAGRPLWDLVCGSFVGFATVLFLVLAAVRPVLLERILTFRVLGGKER